jgi:cysteinyl-tRNA synthetase
MSMTLLGETLDLHCGGVDNIFPHHENEIAQSEAATGKPFVRLWCHSEHLRIAGEKMAKRVGNFMSVQEVLDEGARPAALRYLLAASTHYRKPLNYSDEPLAASNEAVDRLVAFRDRVADLATGDEPGAADDAVLTAVRQARGGFDESMDDDLNLPEAMGAVFTALREINRVLDGGRIAEPTRGALRDLLTQVDDVLGVFPLVDRDRARGGQLTSDEQGLLEVRERARAARDWARADEVRDQLAAAGIAVEDTAAGQKWKRAR